MKYIYPLAIIIVFSAIFTPLNTNAAVLIEQLLNDNELSGNATRHIGQSFTALSNTPITAIRAKPCGRDFTGFDEILTMWQYNGTSTPPIEIASTTFPGVDHFPACSGSTPFFTYILDEAFSVTTGDEFAFTFLATKTTGLFGVSIRFSTLDPYDGGTSFGIATNGDNFVADPTFDVTFQILSDLSFFDDFTSTSTAEALETTCDTTSNLFTNSLCKLGLFLFVPSEAVLSQFSSLQDDLQNKPPFGFLTAIISELENLESATATIALPDLSDLQDNFLTPLKVGISSLLFFMLAFWFFQRFRDFEI